ncbi:hypothetical protein ACQKMI_21250 [Lysinibacillus sp. NPDC097214]|uniref:hypothetical protein n=1 Tax=Lysinibacillus sp. NPDC097214 TaxID=3390584 RepID=UPI003D00179B
MKRIVVWMITFILIFSGLKVSEAEMFVDSQNPVTECEEQTESDGEDELAADCEEQSDSEGEDEPTTENEAQESNKEEDVATEGEGQPEAETEEVPATEGEGHPELETEEKPAAECEERMTSTGEEEPAADCEEQPEPETEEKPVAECMAPTEADSEEVLAPDCEEENEQELEIDCEKYPALDSEGNVVIESDEHLEIDSEEEPTTDGEELTVVDEEEEPATSGEESAELDDQENLAPKCKRDVSNRSIGIPLDQVGKIGDIDFLELGLDTPGELDGFTQMTTNKGLKFSTREDNERTNYLYFGNVRNSRSVSSLEKEGSYVSDVPGEPKDDWSRPLPTMDTTLSSLGDKEHIQAQNFGIVTALAQNPNDKNGVVTYFYKEGIATAFNYPGNGLVIAQGYSIDGKAEFQSGDMPLLKLYKNEKTNELVAYAAVLTQNSMFKLLDGYVKIKMSPVKGIKGRINVNMKYLKLSSKYSYTNIGYSVHMDIAGRHDKSKMFSLGNHEGIYFYEKGMKDNLDYVLSFFRNGYENSPAEFKGKGYDPIGKPFDPNFYYAKLNSPGTREDPGEGNEYPAFMYHPGWALRWMPKKQGAGEIREENLQIAVTNQPDVAPEIHLDNDGEYTDNGYRVTGTWKDKDSNSVSLYYKVDGGELTKIGDYENTKLNTDVSWAYTIPIDKVEKGLDHDITVYIIDEDGQQSDIEINIRPALTIIEQVFNEDGTEIKDIPPGETLRYEILVDAGYISDDTGTYGEVITITQKYDTHLEEPTNLKVIDENGQEIDKATATYTASPNEIIVKLPTDLPRSTKVKVTYNAKVNEEAAEGESVIGQVTVSVKYSTGDAVNQTSNEVKVVIIGVLKFNSAPQVIGFGEKLTISSRDQTYPLIKVDTPLTVKDNRPLSRNPSWTMTAELERPLTKEGTDSTLDGLYYHYGRNVSHLTKDASVQIYKKDTTNREVVNISDTWKSDGDGLYLEVKAGTAKAGIYEGTIKWVLQDVQPNE